MAAQLLRGASTRFQLSTTLDSQLGKSGHAVCGLGIRKLERVSTARLCKFRGCEVTGSKAVLSKRRRGKGGIRADMGGEETRRVPRVLTVAGSDSGAGAGIQADMKACGALGVYCSTAITAITAQNTVGVQGIHSVPAEFVEAQVKSVLMDIGADVSQILQ